MKNKILDFLALAIYLFSMLVVGIATGYLAATNKAVQLTTLGLTFICIFLWAINRLINK